MLNLNSTPKPEYWNDPEWSAFLDKIRLDRSYYRRNWEWAQVAYGLNRLGMLDGKRRGLGVGVGKEPLIFYLATVSEEIVATDMYTRVWARDLQADPSMLTAPEKLSPIPYPADRLRVMRMDALELGFPDESFDFAWSVGAIEHFGSSLPKHAFRLGCRLLGFRKLAGRFDHLGATKAIREIRRVLKPGGIAAITSELILNGRPHHEFFLPEELYRFVVEPSGMELVGGELDPAPSRFFLDHVLPKDRWLTGELPHIVLRDQNGVVFTSVSMFFRKADSTADRKRHYLRAGSK